MIWRAFFYAGLAGLVGFAVVLNLVERVSFFSWFWLVVSGICFVVGSVQKLRGEW